MPRGTPLGLPRQIKTWIWYSTTTTTTTTSGEDVTFVCVFYDQGLETGGFSVDDGATHDEMDTGLDNEGSVR